MNLILSTILVIIFIIIYYLMIQIFTVLFRITGLPKEKAHFQVISLLTNAGFSTKESELIANNSSRRKIAKWTMIIGTVFNVVIASLLINFLFSVSKNNEKESLVIMGITIGVFVALMLIIRIPVIKRGFETLIEKIATKINDKKHHDNVIVELDSYGKKSIVEIYLSHIPSEIENISIANSPLRSRYNIIVLLIQRSGRIIDVKGDTMIQKGDRLVVFGKLANIKDLFDIRSVPKKEKIDDSNLNNLSIVDNYGSNAMVEIEIRDLPSILKDKTLVESGLKEKYDINVLMIRHENKVTLVDAKTKISLGDKVVLIGPYEHIKDLFLKKK